MERRAVCIIVAVALALLSAAAPERMGVWRFCLLAAAMVALEFGS